MITLCKSRDRCIMWPVGACKRMVTCSLVNFFETVLFAISGLRSVAYVLCGESLCADIVACFISTDRVSWAFYGTWMFVTVFARICNCMLSWYCWIHSTSWHHMSLTVSFLKQLRWSRGSVLAFGTKVRGFKPGPSRRIFQGEKKIRSTPSFGREVKPFVPCRRFTACKKIPECYVEAGHFRTKILRPFLAQVVPPCTTSVSGGDTWRCK